MKGNKIFRSMAPDTFELINGLMKLVVAQTINDTVFPSVQKALLDHITLFLRRFNAASKMSKFP